MLQSETHEHAPHSLVAVFATRDYAHRAISRLHEEGFHHTWLGVTEAMGDSMSARSGETSTRIEPDNAFARFFGAGGDTLHEALIKHGVAESDAAQLDNTLPADSAIVTVRGENHPELAAQIVSECEGEMISSVGSGALYDDYASEQTGRSLPKERLSELGGYRAGERLDEAKRLQLRQERLQVDKRMESAGKATVGTRVVSENVELDVPIMHDELYIERRPIAEGSRSMSAGEIGTNETIVVPLERERAVVNKNTVATEEVVVGQRRVQETQHVSETVRKEELDVDDTSIASDRTGKKPLL
ncbi:MAG: hypothetical protein NVS3B17_15900 [Vulcanimicrobiaceae bacterium]